MDGQETVGNTWGELCGREQDGSDDRVDGGEIVGNSFGRAPLGKERYGSDDRADGRETVRERDGSDDRVDGRETVGNSSGRALLGGSEMETMTGWTDGKLWEIARGELFWEGARWKRRQGGRKGNRGK